MASKFFMIFSRSFLYGLYIYIYIHIDKCNKYSIIRVCIWVGNLLFSFYILKIWGLNLRFLNSFSSFELKRNWESGLIYFYLFVLKLEKWHFFLFLSEVDCSKFILVFFYFQSIFLIYRISTNIGILWHFLPFSTSHPSFLTLLHFIIHISPWIENTHKA